MPDPKDKDKPVKTAEETGGAGVAAAAAGAPAPAPLVKVTDPPEDAGKEAERPAGSKASAAEIEETYGITNAEYAILLKTVCKNAPREIAAFFMLFCKRRRLDPFSKQVYLWPDKVDKDTGLPVPLCTWSIVTGIDGFRSIAARNELYRGQSRPRWSFDVDDEGNPFTFDGGESQYGHIAGKRRVEDCEISCFRAIPQAPTDRNLYMEFVEICRFDEYVKRGFTTKDALGKIQGNWEHQPEHQLAIRTEAAVLRKGFPEDVGSLYLEDEMRDRRDEERTRGITVEAVREDTEERTIVDDEIEAAAKELGITSADLYLRRQNFPTKLELLAYLNAEVEKKNETRRNKRDIGAEDAIEAEHRDLPVEPKPVDPILVTGKKPCDVCKAKPGEPHAADCPAPIGDSGDEQGLPL